MVTVYGDEEPTTQEQATPIRFDTSYEQPENLSLDQYIDAAVERAIRKLDAPVATMIRSFNATPDRHENVIIATPQRPNDTVMVTPRQHDNTVVATPNRHVATVVATPEKINTDLDILTILKEEKKIPDETFIDPNDSSSNPRDVATPEPLDTTMTPETNKEDWYESYGWSTPAAVAPAPVPTTSSKEHTPRTPRGEASTQHSIPSELDRDMDADHNFDRSTERETERSEIPHGTDDPQTSRADRHETPLRHTTHHDEHADRNATRNADRNTTRNADRNADRHKVRCTEEVNEDGEPIESSDEEFEEAKEDPPAKRLCEEIEETPSRELVENLQEANSLQAGDEVNCRRLRIVALLSLDCYLFSMRPINLALFGLPPWNKWKRADDSTAGKQLQHLGASRPCYGVPLATGQGRTRLLTSQRCRAGNLLSQESSPREIRFNLSWSQRLLSSINTLLYEEHPTPIAN
ncbi:hypothetical protein GE061_001736 [Apolygus lucorum]|uniref:Uncharacterized protein n=1 Tax=Apolygus lucorum TaxID=248454 RepID=A0A8S9YB80_APOLU|nr:hypothetical protein GE061_001736 [Apolygus lucorum]